MHVAPTIRGVVRVLGLVCVLLVSVCTAHAATVYDGSTPMQCAIQNVMVCDNPMVCVRGTAETINFPPSVKVDIGQRLISGAASGRTARITAVNRDRGFLTMYGTESGAAGVGWAVSIAEGSGKMRGAVVGHEGGFLMFGACAVADGGRPGG